MDANVPWEVFLATPGCCSATGYRATGEALGRIAEASRPLCDTRPWIGASTSALSRKAHPRLGGGPGVRFLDGWR